MSPLTHAIAQRKAFILGRRNACPFFVPPIYPGQRCLARDSTLGDNVPHSEEFNMVSPELPQVTAIEELLTLYAVLAGASDPIRKLSNVHSKIQRAAAAADRICAMMDREPKVVERAEAIELPRQPKVIEFRDVHFSYPGRPPLLKGITLTVHHGETIALVGPNGCGKTTLMNLLPRFWDVDEGSITIDGHDVRDLRIRGFRRQIGIVPQETILFQDTIAANIAYGDPGASRDRIIEAAKRAYAHQFIMTLPEGYDTVIGERGYGLSGGQASASPWRGRCFAIPRS